jgi:hypothetical protein
MVVSLIVTGLLVDGRIGTIIEAVGWGGLAIAIILEVGFRTTRIGDYDGDDRRPS